MNKPPIIPGSGSGGNDINPNPDSPPPLLRSMTDDSAHSSSSCSSLSSESSSSSCSSPTTGAPTTVALHTLYNSSEPLSPRIIIDAIPEEDEGYGTDNDYDNATADGDVVVDGYRRDQSSSRRRRRAAILLVGMVGACVIMIMLSSITHHYSHGSYLPLPLAMLSRIRYPTSHPQLDDTDDGNVNDGRPQPLPSRAGAPSIEKLDHQQGNKELIDEEVETSSSSIDEPSSIDTIDDNEKPASIRSGSSQPQGDTKDKAHMYHGSQTTNDNLHHHSSSTTSFTNLEHSISSTPLTPTQRYTHLYTMLHTYQIEGNIEAAMEIEVQLRGAARYTVGEVVEQVYNGNTMRNRIQSPCKVVEVTFSPVPPLVENNEEGENNKKKKGENNRKLSKEGGMKMKHSHPHPRSHSEEEEVEQDKVHLLANSKLERMERRRLLDEQRRRKRIVMSRIMLEELEDYEEDSSDDEEYWYDEEEDSEDDSSDYDDDEEDDGLYDDYDEEGDYDEHELLSSPPTPSPLRQSHQSSITASSNTSSNNSPIGIRYTLLRLVDGVILNSVPESFLQSYTPYKVNSEALCTIRMMDRQSADDERVNHASNYGVGEERMIPCLIVEYIRPTVTTTVVPHLTTEEEEQPNHLSPMDDNISNDSEDEAEDETNTVQQQPHHEQLRIKEEEDLSKAEYRVQYLNEDEGGNVETILPMGKIQHVVS